MVYVVLLQESPQLVHSTHLLCHCTDHNLTKVLEIDMVVADMGVHVFVVVVVGAVAIGTDFDTVGDAVVAVVMVAAAVAISMVERVVD